MVEESIKRAVEAKNYSIKKLAADIEMTEQGFYKMLKNNSIKVETLEKIAQVLGLPISYFFEGAHKKDNLAISITGDILGNNYQVLNSLSDCVKELVGKDKEIESLKRELAAKNEVIQSKDELIKILSERNR